MVSGGTALELTVSIESEKMTPILDATTQTLLDIGQIATIRGGHLTNFGEMIEATQREGGAARPALLGAIEVLPCWFVGREWKGLYQRGRRCALLGDHQPVVFLH